MSETTRTLDLTALRATQMMTPSAVEAYIFALPSNAHAAGFTGPSLRHCEHAGLQAFCLRDGELLFGQLGPLLISRIVVTGSALRAGYDIPYAGIWLNRLRAQAPMLLRAPPGIYLEL